MPNNQTATKYPKGFVPDAPQYPAGFVPDSAQAAPPTPPVELPTVSATPSIGQRIEQFGLKHPLLREGILGTFGGLGVPETEHPITDLAKSSIHTGLSMAADPLGTLYGMGKGMYENAKGFVGDVRSGEPTREAHAAGQLLGTIGGAALIPGEAKATGEGLDLAGRVLDKPALQAGARDVMANKLDTLQKSIQDEATSRYNEIKAADTADWQAKLDAHKEALAEHTEKLKDPSYKGKPPERPSLGLPIADIQGAMDEKLGKISADTRAKMPRLEAAANEIQAAEAAPDFAHLQTLRNKLYNMAQGTTDSYERAALTAGYDKATDLMEARAKELGHTDTLNEANKKYALSSAIRDARMGSPKPADAYKKLADVTDKDIADTMKAAGSSGERVKAGLKEMEPLARIQKPYGPLGRIAVFKEHPIAAPVGSAIGATALGPLIPGFGHIMGMYAGALGAGELMDRIQAAKLLRGK